MKKSLVFVLCSLFISGCYGGNRFYKEVVPIGEFQSKKFSNDEYDYGKIIITEITKDEYELSNGVNTIAELSGDNTIRKYCSLSLCYFDKYDNKCVINIIDLKYAKGTPSTYYGEIFFESNKEQMGGITFISRTKGIEIITTMNEIEIVSYYGKIIEWEKNKSSWNRRFIFALSRLIHFLI